jgi:hypothetical protein
MPFRFEWMDETQRVMVYIVEGDWNWKTYHHAVRASIFSMTVGDDPIDSMIDLRGSTRPNLPSGLLGHVRSFGRKNQPRLTGRAVVIGMPAEGIEILKLREDNTLPTTDGFVKFVASQEELEEVLQDWANHPPQ